MPDVSEDPTINCLANVLYVQVRNYCRNGEDGMNLTRLLDAFLNGELKEAPPRVQKLFRNLALSSLSHAHQERVP